MFEQSSAPPALAVWAFVRPRADGAPQTQRDFMQKAGTSWTLTRNPAVRRTVKIAVDFSCGALAVLIAFVLQSGRWQPSIAQVAITATFAGVIVAAVNSIGINYRTTWRYAGLKEPLVFMVCSAAVFATVGVLKINAGVPIE